MTGSRNTTDESIGAPRQRYSPQREAVRAILGTGHGFRSAQELHGDLQRRGERIGLATVYRHLQAMAAASEVDVFRTGEGEALFRQCSEEHHHHLICRSCGTAIEVDTPSIEAWAGGIAAEHGFVDPDHSVEIFGICPRCQAGLRG